MPVKIGFHVISCTGEDDRYRATELNHHGPTVRGWRSAFNCTFPQEIVLELDVLALLQQIQILVHQYLIPHKIEIFTNRSETDISPSDDFPDEFDYLGFITFSDNKATGFRSRELKSILIPSKKANYVKLRIHNNHINNKNLFNQVGLVGVNILGEDVTATGEENEFNNNVRHRPNKKFTSNVAYNSNYISPYDDLAFEMYVDEETAKIIRSLEWKKQRAVAEENFEEANVLKLALKDLRAAGEILGLYEQEKKQAIQVEDFDQAKLKKLQIGKLRKKVYSALNIDELLNSPDNEEYRSMENLPNFDGLNKENALKSLQNGSNNEFSTFRDKYLHNLRQMTARQDATGPHSHLIHSKSQTTLTNQNELSSPAFFKNHPFSSSVSNPQIHEYLENVDNENPQSGYQIQVSNVLEPEIDCDETSPSTTSSSSDSEESAIFTTSDVLRCTTKSLDSLDTALSRSVDLRREGEKNEASEMASWNDGPVPEGSRTPPGRSRSMACEESRIRSKSVTTGTVKSSFEAYEDRMVPALKSYYGNEIVRECQLGFAHQNKTTLNERERKQAVLPIAIFGMDLIEKFYSKSFSDKEEGLKELQQELRNVVKSERENNGKTNGNYNKMARAAVFLLHRALRDKVYSVYSGAAETIRIFFTEFVPQRVSSSEVARSVEKLLPELLTKSGDVTPRIHNMAAHTLLSMAECEEVRRLNIIPQKLSRPLMSSVHPRLALSRLEMVEQLILNHGISKDKRSGMTCRTLAEFGSSGLHHPAEAVRKVSERILIQIYKVNPRMVRKQLPPDDNVTRRNLLYRQLFQEFDFMDSQSKIGQRVDEVEEMKKKIIDQTYVRQQSSPERKAFSINNVQEQCKKKSPNFDSQLRTIKNFMSLNLNDKNNVNRSVLKDTSKSPLRNNKSPNKIRTETGPKVEFSLENDADTSKKSTKTLSNNEKKKDGKTKNIFKLINTGKVENTTSKEVKFPSLTDSIDTTKARLLFAQRREAKPKMSESSLPKENPINSTLNIEQRQNVACPSGKETKKSNPSSGIPLPTFGSTRKHYASSPRKATNGKESERSPTKEKNACNDENGKIQNRQINNNKRETREEKKLFEMAEMLETLRKTGGIFPVDTVTCSLKKNTQNGIFRHSRDLGKTAKAVERNNRFSESMLSSIRENEYAVQALDDGSEKNRGTVKTCIFCLTTETWTTDNSLNDHYLVECPMLTTCEYCMEVIEISGFKNHLLDECNQKHLFKKCTKCQQAVLEDLLDNHECLDSSSQTRCPFCHTEMGDDDNCWRQHLMGENTCSNHPRPLH